GGGGGCGRASRVFVLLKKVLAHRWGCPVGFPAAKLEGPEGLSRRIHLAALAPALQVVGPVLVEEMGNELQGLLQVLLDGDAAGPGGGHCQDGDGLVMAGKAGPERHAAAASFLDEGERLGDRCAE